MLVNVGILIGASIATLLGSTVVAKLILRVGGLGVAIIQLIGMGALAYYLFSIGTLGLVGAVLLGVVPIVIRILAVLFLAWIGSRILSGKAGQESQWAAELVQEGDEEFTKATGELSSYDLREVGVIAESKEELRDLTVERYEE